MWAIPGFREGNEFSGTGPFLKALNAPKNAAGDEVDVLIMPTAPIAAPPIAVSRSAAVR